MNSTDKPVNRNTGSIIAKCLIVFVVLGIVCSLSIWAWFTNVQEATAKGISVTAKADGVEVSWDNKDFYYNLTALDDNGMKADSTGKTGKAKFLNEDHSAFGLKLITGDGINFFEPYLNRRTGEHIMDNGAWAGVEINENNSQGRYIDVELFFRSTLQRDIYLAKNSSVTPKNPDGNFSEYGNFSKDYISAASRVAFLDDKEKLSFIWAPNADDLLTESEDGYKKVTEDVSETTPGGASSGIDGGVAEDDGSKYYLWTIQPDANYMNGQRVVSKYYDFIYDADVKYYVATINVIVPSYQADNPSIPFLISESSTSPTTSLHSIDRSASYNKSRVNNGNGSLIMVSNQGYGSASSNSVTIPENNCNQFYMTKTNTLIQGTKVTIKMGFNPNTGLVEVLGYQGNDNWGYDGTNANKPVTKQYYEVANEAKCTLVNPESSVAFSTSEHFVKSVHFKKDSNKLNVLPVSITLNELFTAIKDETEGTGYKATYKFANINPNTNVTKYLSIDGGTVVLNGTGSKFKLEYIEEDFGPVLVSEDGYCLICVNNTMKAVKFDKNLDKSTVVTVYTGISYELKHDQALEEYKYYSIDDGVVTITPNSSTSDIKLYTTNAGETSTDSIGPAIVTLTKAKESDPYYTAKIIMRIWVEGEDREAKTPLADGIFDLSIHFTSK